MRNRGEERFEDREEAGRLLAAALARYQGHDDVVVLALPRGGVPVGFQVADTLQAPLEVLLVRKLGVPGHEELAMGAILPGGVRVLNDEVVSQLGITPSVIDRVAERESVELRRRDEAYRRGRPSVELRGKTVILVDDGLATGSTMRAAVVGLRQRAPARVVVAVPVGPAETCEELRGSADEIVCLRTPAPFYAIGLWYRDFAQVSDDEVRDLLDRAVEERRLP